jgi:phosphate transport system substrate-binding protein
MPFVDIETVCCLHENRNTAREEICLLQKALVLAALWLSCSAMGACKDIALIANKSNPVKNVPLADLLKICKGQTSRWPDGKPVTLIIRNPGSHEMRLVLEKIYSMPKDEVASLILAANHGRANHPAIIIVDSDQSLVQSVEATSGAVGLVDVYSITGGINVLRVSGKLPLEPGYVLHGN